MKLHLFAITLIALGALPTFAYPQLSPKCAESTSLKHPKNSSGVYYNEDCTTVYVLPPSNGTVVVSSLSPNQSLSRCESFERVLNIIEQNYVQADKLMKEYWKDSTGKNGSGSPLGSGGGGLGGAGPLTGNRPGSNTQENEAAADARRAKILAQYDQAMKLASEAEVRLEPFKNIEGATGQMTFAANWQALVDEYSRNNPEFTFQRLNLSKQILSYTRKLSSDGLSMPAAFKVQLPGLKPTNLDGSTIGDEANVVFGESMSGQVVLSLAGSCPFYNNAAKTLKTRISGSELSAHFTPNVQFEFNLQTKREYIASFNLGQLMKRIQESGSRGGFFSSSSYSKLLIEKNSEDWFKFKVEDEDPRFAYDVDSLRASVKADLINRVTRSIVDMNGGDPNSVPSPAAPGVRGSELASAALKKCPNQYCQLGAVALDILNATFGSSSTNSTYINSNNYWSHESSEERKAIPFTGSYTFVGGQ